MLQVPIIHNNIAHCFIPVCMENVISMYCEYMGLEYQAIFTQAYTFHFDKTMCGSGRIADGLTVKYDCFSWLERLYQIKMRKKSFLFFSSMIKYLSKRIEKNQPCIIHMDSYYLEWSSFFQKEHTLHFVLVTDVNQEKKTITVIDSIDREQPEELSFDTLKSGCQFILELQQPKKPIKINQQSLERAILEGSYEVIDVNRFEEMEEFAQAFQQMFSPDVEFRDKQNAVLMATEKMVDELRKNIKGINLFVLWMLWREEHTKSDRFHDAICQYRQVMSQWNLFINILYKKSLSGWEDDFYQKAYDKIMEITGLEREAYQSFLTGLKEEKPQSDYENNSDGEKTKKKTKKIYIPLDLHGFMNNDGFCGGSHKAKGNLTGVGEYFVWDKEPEGQLEADGIPFLLETNNKYNNIICQGQKLILPEERNAELKNRKLQGIAMICCAEWGTSWERIECMRKDDTVFQIPVLIKDIAQYEENNACLFGKTFGKTGELIRQRAAVFVEKMEFPQEEFCQIILPKAENIHILALTLIA